MLGLRELRYRYPGGSRALDGVELEVRGGQLCALVGANGSGKSTLLRLAALTLRPASGEVQLFGRTWSSARAVASRVAWIGQRAALDPTMTGTEHLRLQAALMGLDRRTSAARIAALADGLRLADAADRFVSTYSGGMRRRLHLALGLVHDPELLLLDEPTAGLDPDGQAAVWRFLAERAAGGCGLLVVTHDLPRAQAHADHVVFLEAGRVAGAGAPSRLAAEHGGELLAAYPALTGRDARDLLGRQPSRDAGAGRRRGRARG